MTRGQIPVVSVPQRPYLLHRLWTLFFPPDISVRPDRSSLFVWPASSPVRFSGDERIISSLEPSSTGAAANQRSGIAAQKKGPGPGIVVKQIIAERQAVRLCRREAGSREERFQHL